MLGANLDHRYRVYQVDFTNLPTTTASTVGMTTKANDNVRIRQIDGAEWNKRMIGDKPVDHALGSNVSLTYAVALAADAAEDGGACPASSSGAAEISISVIGRFEASRWGGKSAVGVALGTSIPDTRTALGIGSFPISFSGCGDDYEQLVTLYNIPDSDDSHHILTLGHQLTKRDGTSVASPVGGPTLQVYIYDQSYVIGYVASPYHEIGSWNYYNYSKLLEHRVLPHGVYEMFLLTDPTTPSGQPPSVWWEGCADHPSTDASEEARARFASYPWARYCPLPPWQAPDAEKSTWVEFCYKLPFPSAYDRSPSYPLRSLTLVPYLKESGAKHYNLNQYQNGKYVNGEAPAYELQFYSTIVNDGDQCRTVAKAKAADSSISGEWLTFFDGSHPGEHYDDYRIGENPLPNSHLNQYVNMRVRSVVGIGHDGTNEVRTNISGKHRRVWFGVLELEQSRIQGAIYIETKSRGVYPGPWPRLSQPGDDCSNSVTYACTLDAPTTAGASTTAIGDVQYRNDYDWFEVSLAAGKEYRIQVSGYSGDSRIHALSRGYVYLVRDANGVPIDATGGTVTRHTDGFSFTVGSSGKYYIELSHDNAPANAWEYVPTGAYQLKLILK